MSVRGMYRNRYDSAVETFRSFRRRVVALKQLTVDFPGAWPELEVQLPAIQSATQTIATALQTLNASRPVSDTGDP